MLSDIRIGDKVELTIEYPIIGGTVTRKVRAKYVDTLIGKPDPVKVRRYYGMNFPPDAFDAKPYVRHVFLRENGHHIVGPLGQRMTAKKVSK